MVTDEAMTSLGKIGNFFFFRVAFTKIRFILSNAKWLLGNELGVEGWVWGPDRTESHIYHSYSQIQHESSYIIYKLIYPSLHSLKEYVILKLQTGTLLFSLNF